MEKTLTINSYLKKRNIRQIPSIPKLTINPYYKFTISHNKICPNSSYNKMENKIINTELSTKFNDYNLLNTKTFDTPKKYLFKTIWTDTSSSLNRNNRKALFLKTCNAKVTKRTNKSQKVSMKILNDFFKPSITKNNKSFFTPKKQKRISKNFNFSSENKKEMSPNNYLYYYFPNLFNVPNNRIVGPQNLNSSKFFVAPLPPLSFKEEVKNLQVFPVFKRNKENTKTPCISIISDYKENKENKEQKNPVFIEKLYKIDVLKNLRFGFKNSVEKSKYCNLIKSFYTAKNLKFILPKS